MKKIEKLRENTKLKNEEKYFFDISYKKWKKLKKMKKFREKIKNWQKSIKLKKNIFFIFFW